MRKPKAAAILGVLILCGLVVLGVGIRPQNTTSSLFHHWTSVAIAAGDTYFAKLQGAFTRACSDEAALVGIPDFFDVCALVVHALKSLTPSSTPEQVAEAIVGQIGKELEASSQGSTDACAECVSFVQDIEIFLAANGTVEGLDEALVAACEKRFSKPAEANQCRTIVGALQIPAAVDLLLSDFPPHILCQQLKICPL